MKYLLFFLCTTVGISQMPFSSEVKSIQKKYDTLWDSSKETTVFTGSSSIRVWKNLEQQFPEHHIVNSGFGGSKAIDLLTYTNELILDYQPNKVFIYEGDNDIAGKQKPKYIIAVTREIIKQITQQDSTTKIVLISAKPSIARWKLRRKYKRLNRMLKKLTEANRLLEYADIWTPMLDRRKVKRDIFVSDGLHMNAKGYDIWFNVIKKYID